MSPCLTRSRAHGYWISNRGRRMNLREIVKLQGFVVQKGGIKGVKIPVGTSDRQSAQLLGNAMSLPVIEDVMRAGLVSIGLDLGQ